MSKNTRLFYGGVGVLTAATLLLELSLTRIFSVIMFYHFAFLAISLALFGIGLSGIYVYLQPRLLEEQRRNRVLALYGILAGVSAFACLPPIFQQSAHLGFRTPTFSALGVIYLFASAPFFFSGVCLTILIEHFRKDMGRLYFYDLVGAGIGCLLLTPILGEFGGIHSVLFAGLLFFVSTWMFLWAGGASRKTWAVFSCFGIAALGFFVYSLRTPILKIPSVKEIVEQRVIYHQWNSFSRVTLEDVPHKYYMWIRMDSSAATAMNRKHAIDQPEKYLFSDASTKLGNLLYYLDIPGEAVIIGPGGGTEVAAAVARGRQQVIGVELNPIIIDIVKRRYRHLNGDIYNHPNVTIHNAEGRNFIRSSKRRFGSIQATLVDTWAATAAGAFSLSENSLYTREAFYEYLDHLLPQGILAMQRWKQPQHEFLRLLVLGRAGLQDHGISGETHYKHFFAASKGIYTSMFLKKTPFTASEIARLERECNSAKLVIEHTPSRPLNNPFAEFLRKPRWEETVQKHPFDISPPPDDRPFFFYMHRPTDSLQLFSLRGLPSHNHGLLIILLALVVVSILLLLFFLLPLFLFRREALRENKIQKIRYLLYFFSLGIAFIVIEIGMMQRFSLFLGHPMYALIVILFTVLVASGIGSLAIRSTPEAESLTKIKRHIFLLCVLIAAYHIALPTIFHAFAAAPLFLRILLTVVLLTPMGFWMGSLLPLGIQGAPSAFQSLIPWAWGINGAASVLGSILAMLLALHIGFSYAIFVGIVVYLFGLLMLRGTEVPPAMKEAVPSPQTTSSTQA